MYLISYNIASLFDKGLTAPAKTITQDDFFVSALRHDDDIDDDLAFTSLFTLLKSY